MQPENLANEEVSDLIISISTKTMVDLFLAVGNKNLCRPSRFFGVRYPGSLLPRNRTIVVPKSSSLGRFAEKYLQDYPVETLPTSTPTRATTVDRATANRQGEGRRLEPEPHL